MTHLIMATSVVEDVPSSDTELREFLSQFNITPIDLNIVFRLAGENDMRNLVQRTFRNVDLPSFADQSYKFIRKHDPDKAELLWQEFRNSGGTIKDVEISGETGKAMLSGKEIHFLKIEGPWFLKLESPS